MTINLVLFILTKKEFGLWYDLKVFQDNIHQARPADLLFPIPLAHAVLFPNPWWEEMCRAFELNGYPITLTYLFYNGKNVHPRHSSWSCLWFHSSRSCAFLSTISSVSEPRLDFVVVNSFGGHRSQEQKKLHQTTKKRFKRETQLTPGFMKQWYNLIGLGRFKNKNYTFDITLLSSLIGSL